MKVNERTLIRYAFSPGTQVTKQGWLLKKSKDKAEYQRKYCVLKGNFLFLFDKPTDREPVTALLLEGCRVELDDADSQLFAFRIVFAPPANRQHVFCTDSQQSLESWMKVLATCSMGIIRLMASELKRELQQIENENQSMIASAKSANVLTSGISSIASFAPTTRANPFDQQNLIDLDDAFGKTSTASVRQTTDLNQPKSDQIMFSRRPFIDLHQYYGLQFAKYFERKQKPKSVDDLLFL